MTVSEEEFRRAVEGAFTPVHEALARALAGLAEKGIAARMYFNAEAGLLLAWAERPGPGKSWAEHTPPTGHGGPSHARRHHQPLTKARAGPSPGEPLPSKLKAQKSHIQP